ncbi:hypothetical protein [Deinococcus sp.]|uniref:hypothetical protein n=1 Tax=Deinococcus sp. TaxID=47478 RepID=UPI003C7CC031
MTRNILTLAAALSLGLSFAANPPVTTPAKPAALPAPAAAGAVITTVTPESMLALVQAAGYTAKLDKSGDNPELTLTRKGAVDIYLNFHTCKTGSCTEMDAYTYYTSGDLKTAPAESDMSDWNSNHYTQAYIDANDDDSVNLDSLYRFTGGFTKANFLNWLNEFRKDADSFDKMLKAL